MPRPLVVPADLNLFLYFATLSFTIQSSFFLVFVFRKMHKGRQSPIHETIRRQHYALPVGTAASLRLLTSPPADAASAVAHRGN